MNKKKKMNNKGECDMIFPEVIIEDILSRLPVKSLVRFRCVSKSWNTLIRDPHFVDMYLNRSKQNTSNLKIIIRFDDDDDDAEEFPSPIAFQYLGLSVDITFCERLLGVSGSCNGLLLLTSKTDFSEDYPAIGEELWLWNPSTRQKKEIPKPPCQYIEREEYHIHYGLGYNESSKDYRIVRIRSYFIAKEYAIPAQVTVYSLRSNTWKTVPITGNEDIPFINRAVDGPLHAAEAGVLVNGALHWAATNTPPRWSYEEEHKYIIAFDVEDENFREVPYPDYNGEEHSDGIEVAALDGKLYLLCHSELDSHVWLMRDYGLGNSWTKLFSIKKDIVNHSCRPLCFMKKDANILLFDSDLYLFNLKDKSLTKVYDLHCFVKRTCDTLATTYVESLTALGTNSEAVG